MLQLTTSGKIKVSCNTIIKQLNSRKRRRKQLLLLLSMLKRLKSLILFNTSITYFKNISNNLLFTHSFSIF